MEKEIVQPQKKSQTQLCPSCKTESKPNAKVCKKCGYDFTAPPVWIPTWQWHLKTLGIIYFVLIISFFFLKWALRKLPPPYDIRQIPPEMTPWLKK